MPPGILAIAIGLNVVTLLVLFWGSRHLANQRFARGEALLVQELSTNPRAGEVVLTTERVVWFRGQDREEFLVDEMQDVRDTSSPPMRVATPARMIVTIGDRETAFEISIPKEDLAGWIEAVSQRVGRR
jgi:hypothetical protein